MKAEKASDITVSREWLLSVQDTMFNDLLFRTLRISSCIFVEHPNSFSF